MWLNFVVRREELLIGRLEATVSGDRAEVAYLFRPSAWVQGFATEALLWLQDYCVSSEGVREFWAAVSPKNERSIRMLKRLGYVESDLEGVTHLAHYYPDCLLFRRTATAGLASKQTE